MLEFCSTLHTKLVGEWIGRTARGASGGRDGSSCFVFARRDLAANQRVEVRVGLNVFDLLKDQGRFGAHLSANFPVILFRELSAFVLEVEILNIAESDLLLSLKQVPLGLFHNSRLQRLLFTEQRDTNRAEYGAAED